MRRLVHVHVPALPFNQSRDRCAKEYSWSAFVVTAASIIGLDLLPGDNASDFGNSLHGDQSARIFDRRVIRSEEAAPAPITGFMLVVALVAVSACVWGAVAGRVFAKTWEGVCVGCGYDLTGNTSGVSPECGRAIKSTKD